jgi:hypothetical protein
MKESGIRCRFDSRMQILKALPNERTYHSLGPAAGRLAGAVQLLRMSWR